jgi:hypothetical protein
MASARITLLSLIVGGSAFAQVAHDIVIRGGRVIDPETSLDGVRDIGIRGNQIAAISEQPLIGLRVIAASGLVVAPGFIDLHDHDQTAAGYRLKAMDGVTTTLELEIGPPDVRTFLEVRRNGTLINYGTSASHAWARGDLRPARRRRSGNCAAQWSRNERSRDSGADTADAAAPARRAQRWRPRRRHGDSVHTRRDAAGDNRDVWVAAERNMPVFVHSRGSGIESVGEVIAAAAVTGAPLHIVHINSSCLREAPECLRMVAGARGRGLDVTTEAYPYIAGMTQIISALFNPGWKEKFSMDSLPE